tara:strand:- start:230 stop:823 length:594 start_codon:yes stop_codon:yes gene_type:complete
MLRKIRSLVSNSDYFGIYDNALSKKECEIIINQFEKSEQGPGKVYLDGVLQEVPAYKKCMTLDASNFDDGSVITNIVRPQLAKCNQRYNFEQPQLREISRWSLYSNYSIQKYETEDDGYKEWHAEAGGSGPVSNRILAWMFYLNNAKSGTEFMNYPTIRAKMGRCVIWPAGWTHVHRGVTPNKGLKYIVTGWITFDE